MKHSTFARTVVLVSAAAAGLAAAVLPGRPAAAVDTPVEPVIETVLPANDKEKAEILASVAEAAESKTSEPLVKALTAMGTRKHEEFLPIIRENTDASDPAIQAAAIHAAGANEMKDVERTVRKILRLKPKKGDANEVPTPVTVACVAYLDRLGISGEERTVLDDVLRPFTAEERRIKQPWAKDFERITLHYFGKMKFKGCVQFLIEEMLPAPEPKPVAPGKPDTNPPPPYWEARTKLWYDHEGWTRWALKEITGQTFRSAREWQAWFKQQDKKAYK